MMGLFGSSPVADKLASLTGFVYDKWQVARAMSLLRNHTDSARADRRSRFVGHGVTWVMTGAPSADSDGVEVLGVADADAAGVSMSEHLRNTAVERCAHCQSDRAWRKAESLITQRRGEDGRIRRVRIGNELLSSLQQNQIKLWRDIYCRSVLGLPPLDFLFGSATGVEQLHLFENAPVLAGVESSAWGGPGISNGVVKCEAWREAAVRVVCSHYDGDGPRNFETLLPGISSHDLRLMLGLRVGRRVQGDVHPPILVNVNWLLSEIDSSDLTDVSICAGVQREVEFVGHTALLALRVWTAEGNIASRALELAAYLERSAVLDLVAQPAVVFSPTAGGAVVLAVKFCRSELCEGDVLIECEGVDVRGFAPVPLQLVTRGPAGSTKRLRVVRDGLGVTVREHLCDSSDLLSWQQNVAVRLEAQYALHDAQFDLMLRATDAVAAAYGNSRHGRLATWTTTRFRLALLPPTLSLFSGSKDDVCEYLAQRLQTSDVIFDLCADEQGHWSLGLPKPDCLTAGETALSVWAEESLLVQMPARAMGCVMRLSSALGYMLVRILESCK